MNFAILAAGEGSRLAQEGVEQPKPLVKINGEAMIDRLIRVFKSCGADEIAIITNNLTPLTQEHLQQLQAFDPQIHVLVKTTPSSMHSFYELHKQIEKGKFCLTTVDTIFDEEEFRRFIKAFEQSEGDGIMAVTDYIDDEKPLYISTKNGSNLITGFHDSMEQFEKSEASQYSQCRYISGGIYCLTDKAFAVLEKCIESGMSRMRNFQRQLIAEGLTLCAYPFSKILDVDHASDILKAEEFLAERKSSSNNSCTEKYKVPKKQLNILGILRGADFSPNMQSADRAIMEAVKDRLEAKGHRITLCTEESLKDIGYDLSGYDIVLSMARSKETLRLLRENNTADILARIINSLKSVETCTQRIKAEALMKQHGLSVKDSFIHKETDAELMVSPIPYPVWIKNGEQCATRREDTVYVTDDEGFRQAMKDFRERSISNFIIQQHIEGDLIKFYGVAGTEFFHWKYASEGHSKFGLEAINGKEKGFRFDTFELKKKADKAAAILHTPVYGGDCIVTEEGNIHIIDFNDWPSFSSCRQDAASAIADMALATYNGR